MKIYTLNCNQMSPTIFRVRGYRFYFLSNEEKRVHVHVTSEDGEAKFWLEPIIYLASSIKFSPVKLNEIQEIIEERHDEVIEAWGRHFGKR